MNIIRPSSNLPSKNNNASCGHVHTHKRETKLSLYTWIKDYFNFPVKTALCVTAILVFSLSIVYHNIIFGPWKLSFTNVQYAFPPFSSLGVEYSGELLSDPADNVLPIAWVTYHLSSFTTWLSSFGIGAPQNMSLYLSPLNWLYALPFDYAQQIISIVKFIVSFIGMYFFSRTIGLSPKGATIGGLTFSFSSTMVMWHGWPHSEVSMYAPYLFGIIELMLKRIRVRYLALISVIIYLMIVPGMPTYAAYYFYLGVTYGIYFAIRTHWGHPNKILVYVIACCLPAIIGILLSLPYSGELLLSVGGSGGYAESRSSYASAVLPVSQIKTLFLPYVETSATGIVHLNESTLYTGILGVLSLGLTFLRFKSKPKAGFFFVSSMVMMLLIFTNVLSPFFKLIPFINTSLKFRVIVLLNFSLSALLAINLDDLLNAPIKEPRDRIIALISSCTAVVLFFALIWYTRNQINGARTSDFARFEVLVCSFIALAYVLVVVFRCWVSSRAAAHLSALCLIVSVAVDMGCFASNYLPLIDKTASVIPPATESINFLKENTDDGARFVSAGNHWTLFPSTNMFYGINDARGHGLVYTNEDISEYFSSIGGSSMNGTASNPSWEEILDDSLLKYMGVRYVVYSRDDFEKKQISLQHPDWIFHFQDDGTVVCELSDYSEKVEIISRCVYLDSESEVLDKMRSTYSSDTLLLSSTHDTVGTPYIEDRSIEPGETVSIIDNAEDSLSFMTTTKHDRFVVVNNYNDGNWVAYIDGEQSEVYKGNYLFCVIRVPEGTHTVEIRHESKSLCLFFGISSVSFAGLIAGCLMHRRINRQFIPYNTTESPSLQSTAE